MMSFCQIATMPVEMAGTSSVTRMQMLVSGVRRKRDARLDRGVCGVPEAESNLTRYSNMTKLSTTTLPRTVLP